MTPFKQQKITELLTKIRNAHHGPHDRAKLSEELNDIRPPISVLPPEILSHIFQYVFHLPRKPLFRIVSLVSRHWRRVLVNTPELWAIIDLDVSSPRGKSILPTFIANSGDCALSVTFRFRGRINREEQTLVDPSVDSRIIENFGRIQSLSLTNPPISWFDGLPQLQRLQHLTLQNHEGPRVPTSIPVDRMPSVSELTLINLKSVQLDTRCLNITSLTLTQIRITTTVRIFTQCPFLKYLHLEYLDRVQDPANRFAGADGQDNNFPNKTILLPNLETLVWFVGKPQDIFVLSWQMAIITHLTVPSLKSLKWDQKVDFSGHLRSIVGFFGRVALTLTDLEFSRVGQTGTVISGEVFVDDCAVERMVFSDCGSDFVDGILQDVKSPTRFPGLKKVEMRKNGRLVERAVVQRYVRLLKQRKGLVFNNVIIVKVLDPQTTSMAEPSPPPIQQPQPSLPQPAFVPGGQMVPGQPPPAIPGQGPMDTTPTAPAVDGQTPVVVAVEENPCETLYIQNLNEKVKPQVLQATLRGLFKSYGDVLDVVAHGNMRMRGQAFVSFDSVDSARKAMKDVQRFPLYSKPMQITFAKTRSDAVVKKLDAESYDQHKQRRDEHKKATRYTNPIKSKFRLKRMAAEMDGGAALPQSKRPAVQMPDEYLPPNKILFLQNLPESVTKDQLMSLFSQYPNLYEVRMIPTKKDIAFVEYVDEGSAGVAKDALHNYKLDGENKIKITFARK
ncbi:hypothetical protein Agabi119p4_1077 [Agaricus bisporus var. burnettii]|uniref:RRM domain-containing protein n=1 Tax=Agaricus bisporus var. burnettii TaxID=192524 RepID=A0A8H7FBS7_AGABI|nr:hypothetical protein Agabi119p4_1077 [Agaricus bisporus var. burnettii]